MKEFYIIGDLADHIGDVNELDRYDVRVLDMIKANSPEEALEEFYSKNDPKNFTISHIAEVVNKVYNLPNMR